jgi:uncharacterized protein
MALTVTHEPDADRYVALDEGGEVRGIVVYDASPGVLRLIHAEVPPFLRNKGVGGEVVQAVLDHLRTESSDRIVPSCPFVVMWMRRHPEYADLATR